MSTPATIPVFDPQGVLRDVPQDQFKAAVDSGGKPAVRFQAPDGKTRYVPASMTADAVKAGGKMLPIEQQDVQHPGFWQALASDLSGLIHPSGFNPYPGMGQDEKATAAGQAYEQDQQRAQEGRSLAYRAAVPFGQSVGLNVPGMEESARAGDVSGVMGHAAAVPTMLAAGEALARGGPRVAEQAAPVVRAGVRGINKGLEKAPGTIGGTAGAALGGYVGGHIGAEIGGAAGAMAGHELLPQVRIPGEGFGLPNRVTGGPSSAPPYAVYPGASLPENPGMFPGAPLPQAPSAELLQARGLAQGATVAPPENAAALGQIGNPKPAITAPTNGLPNPSPEAAATIPRTLSGEGALAEVLTRLDNQSLMKIAKSRGISIAQEAQLKPGVANNLLIRKISADFSPDELSEFRSKYLETNRYQHEFPATMTPESWSTIALTNYFPNVRVPLTALRRAAIAAQGVK